MKYFIASDIHGSAFWCKKMLEAFKNEKADRMILLGDILYHGPRNDLPEGHSPKEVIDMLNQLKGKVISVRGNCEAEVDQMVLNFPVLADYTMLEWEDKTVFLTHGHIYNENALPPLCDGDVLVHGHTHVPVCEKREGYMLINPGSVSIPKENSHHGYAIFESGEFTLKDLEGNTKASIKI